MNYLQCGWTTNKDFMSLHSHCDWLVFEVYYCYVLTSFLSISLFWTLSFPLSPVSVACQFCSSWPHPFAKIRLLDVTTRLIRRSHHVLNTDRPSGALSHHPGPSSPSPIHHLTPSPSPIPLQDLPAHARDKLPSPGSPLALSSAPSGDMSLQKHRQLGGGVMGSDRDLQSTASSISLPTVKKAPKKRRLSLASLFRRRGREPKSGRPRSRDLHHPGPGGPGGVDGIASIENIHSEMCNDKNSAFFSVAGVALNAAAAASTPSASGPSSSTSSSKLGGGVGTELLECPLCLLRHSRESFPDIMTCHHRSCIDCLRQYLRIEISESRVNISCPECSERFNPHDIRIILGDRALMEKYEEFILRRWLVADPDCRWCPAPDCG